MEEEKKDHESSSESEDLEEKPQKIEFKFDFTDANLKRN